MPNVTISMSEELLKHSREYAQQNQTSLNALIRRLLEEAVMPEFGHFLDDCFRLMDRADGNSRGEEWTRVDLYDE
jgi:hypothetical protein